MYYPFFTPDLLYVETTLKMRVLLTHKVSQ